MENTNNCNEISSSVLDEYLNEIEEFKKSFSTFIKNTDDINEGFNSLRALALKTEFLRTQCQMLCLKNNINI